MHFTTLLFPSVSVTLCHHRHTPAVQPKHDKCFMCRSGVLHCVLSLLLWCETVFVMIDSFRLMLANNMIMEENCVSNLLFTPLLTPVIRVSAHAVAICTVFTFDLMCTYEIFSGLSKNTHNSCVMCCRVGSLELSEMT